MPVVSTKTGPGRKYMQMRVWMKFQPVGAKVAVLALAVLELAGSALAQTVGTLRGTVTDPLPPSCRARPWSPRATG